MATIVKDSGSEQIGHDHQRDHMPDIYVTTRKSSRITVIK